MTGTLTSGKSLIQGTETAQFPPTIQGKKH